MLPFIAFYNMLSVPNSTNKPFWKMAKSPAAPWIQDIFANFQLCLFYSCDTQLHAIFEKKTIEQSLDLFNHWQTEKADYYGPYQVNMGHKIYFWFHYVMM